MNTQYFWPDVCNDTFKNAIGIRVQSQMTNTIRIQNIVRITHEENKYRRCAKYKVYIGYAVA